MARVGHSIEKLLEITGENSLTGFQLLFGSGAPGGDAGEQDDAPIGAFYSDSGTGHLYQKVADANSAADWKRDGFLSSGYAAAGGDPAAGDQLEDAIAKIDDNLDDLTLAVGIAQGDQNMGTYTGSILNDNETAKQNLQQLETYIEANIIQDFSFDGVTTSQVIDDELVDDILAAQYEVVISLNSAPERRVIVVVNMGHDGTASSDATAVDDTVFAKLKFGAAFNYTLSTSLNGTGASQVMQLNVASGEVGGVDVRASRITRVLA